MFTKAVSVDSVNGREQREKKKVVLIARLDTTFAKIDLQSQPLCQKDRCSLDLHYEK